MESVEGVAEATGNGPRAVGFTAGGLPVHATVVEGNILPLRN